MARSYNDQQTLLGKQTGTGPSPATAAFSSLKTLFLRKDERKEFRSNGSNVTGAVKKTKEWSEASVEGPLSYDESGRIFAQTLGAPTSTAISTPTDTDGDGDLDTGKTRHVWTPPSRGRISPVLYTYEQGDDTIARAYAGVFGTGYEYGFVRESGDTTFSADLLGGAEVELEDGFSVDPDDVIDTPLPISPEEVDLYWSDTLAGLDQPAALQDPLSVTVTASDLQNPVWTLNSTRKSFATTTKGEVTFRVAVTWLAEDTGDKGRTTSGKHFARLVAKDGEGNVFKHTFCLTALEPGDEDDNNGALAQEITYGLLHDKTWGKSQEIELINRIASY